MVDCVIHVQNHNLTFTYDFHSYMIRSMEDEFKQIVGISAPLWGFVIAFMLFDVNGSNLYFWISFVPLLLVFLVGAKLQHVIATLALENAGVTGSHDGAKLNPRDELFWFNKPELLLSLIHFILFQITNTLFGGQFCRTHLSWPHSFGFGFAGQFLCSYSTLALYALVTQMGTHFKAALISPRIRETIHGWGKEAKRRHRQGDVKDDSTVRSVDKSTRGSIEGIDVITHEESFTGGSGNQTDYHVNNDLTEIEMESTSLISMVPNDDPNFGHVTRHRSLSSLPAETLSSPPPETPEAARLKRFFTQPRPI
eukprot:Gb_14171 [translate_table: standard]